MVLAPPALPKFTTALINPLKSIPELQKHYNNLKSDEWRFGESPQFDHHLEERFDWGTINVHLNSSKGHITDVKIYSDALNTQMIDLLTNHLQGAQYHKDAILESINAVQKKLPEVKDYLQEFSDWIVKEIE